ncbi:MAG: thiamine pyrophosphate-binding protein [Polyangiaceae bacterium]
MQPDSTLPILRELPRPRSEIRRRLPRARAKVRQRRAADLIVETLVAAGVDTVFALPGGTISPVLDACYERSSIRLVTTRHESGAMFAAAGLSRATEKLGVVCVTSGPGFLNAMTGLANAHCEGIPLLLLAGEVPRKLHGRRALQEGSAHHLDVLAMARPVAKLALEITSADAASAIIRRAIQTAMSGRRGPVVVTVPLDISLAKVVAPVISAGVSIDLGGQSPEVQAAIDHAAGCLASAKSPVVLVGSGVRQGQGPEALLHFAEELQAPVMTTPKAKGVFPESHPLSVGVFGHGGHPSASECLGDGVDVLLAVGTSFSDPGTDGWSPLLEPSRELIHVDVDALQIGRNYRVTQGIVGDAAWVLSGLAARLPAARRPRRYGLRRLEDPASEAKGRSGLITPQRALWELQQVLPADTFYTCDIGEHLMFATHFLTIDPPGGFMAMNGLASMGSGLCSSLGVQLADMKRTVVSICGDGVFAMNGNEVATAAAERLPIIFAVLNDGRFGMVERGHSALYGRTPSFSTHPTEISRVAEAFGADSLVIRRPGDILMTHLGSRSGPLVLDIHIDRSAEMPKTPRFDELKRHT